MRLRYDGASINSNVNNIHRKLSGPDMYSRAQSTTNETRGLPQRDNMSKLPRNKNTISLPKIRSYGADSNDGLYRSSLQSGNRSPFQRGLPPSRGNVPSYSSFDSVPRRNIPVSNAYDRGGMFPHIAASPIDRPAYLGKNKRRRSENRKNRNRNDQMWRPKQQDWYGPDISGTFDDRDFLDEATFAAARDGKIRDEYYLRGQMDGRLAQS